MLVIVIFFTGCGRIYVNAFKFSNLYSLFEKPNMVFCN